MKKQEISPASVAFHQSSAKRLLVPKIQVDNKYNTWYNNCWCSRSHVSSLQTLTVFITSEDEDDDDDDNNDEDVPSKKEESEDDDDELGGLFEL